MWPAFHLSLNILEPPVRSERTISIGTHDRDRFGESQNDSNDHSPRDMWITIAVPKAFA